MTKLYNSCMTVFKIILSCILFYLFITSISLTCKTFKGQFIAYCDDSSINNLAVIFSLIIVLFIIKRLKLKISINNARIVKWIIIAVTFVMSLFVLSTQYAPSDDPSVVLGCARAINLGNYKNWLVGEYCFYYSYQAGIILLLWLNTLLFGANNFIMAQLFNVLFLVLAYYYIYKLTVDLSDNETVNTISLLGMCLYLPYNLFVSFVYGTIVGYCFAVMALFYAGKYIKSKKFINAVLAGLFMAVAVLAKPNYGIYLIALIIMYFLCMIRDRNWKYFGAAVCAVSVYILVSFVCQAIISARINQEIPEGVPFSTVVVMGLSDDAVAPGWHNAVSIDIYDESGHDIDLTNSTAFDKIKDRIKEFAENPRYMLDFFNKKQVSQWINPTFECFQIYEGRKSNLDVPVYITSILNPTSSCNKVIVAILDRIQSIIIFGAIIWLILNLRKTDVEKCVLLIVFVGGFIFHTFAEARSYYTVPYFVLLIPYAVNGYYSITDLLDRKITVNNLKSKKLQYAGAGFVSVIILFAVCLVSQKVSQVYAAKEDEYIQYYEGRETYLEDGYYMIKPYSADDMVLGINKHMEGHLKKVHLLKAKNNDDRQIFYLKNMPDASENNIYLMWNKYNHNFLSAYNIEGDEPYYGLVLRRLEQTQEMQWYLQKADDGYYVYYIDCDLHYLELREKEGKTFVRINNFTGKDNQKWKFERVN